MLVLPACLLGSLGLSPPSSRQWLRHKHLNTAVWAMEALWASEVRAPLWGSSRLLLRRWSCRTVSPDPAVAGRRRTDDVSISPCVFLAEGPCCFGRRWDSLGANGASPRTASDWPAGDLALHSVSRARPQGRRPVLRLGSVTRCATLRTDGESGCPCALKKNGIKHHVIGSDYFIII